MIAPIHSLTPVRGSLAGDPAGLLGALLHDPESRTGLVALTAAQVALAGAPLRTDTDGRGEILGEERAFHFLTGDSEQPAHHMIGAVPLRSSPIGAGPRYVVPVAESDRLKDLIIEDVWPMIGAGVWVTNKRGVARPARLASAQGSFTMPRPGDNGRTLFLDALRLTSIDGSPLVGRGDAGALVRAKDGRLLGLVVAASDGVAFAARLWPVAVEFSLTPLTSKEIAVSNEGVRHSPLRGYTRADAALKGRRASKNQSDVVEKHRGEIMLAREVLA